MNYLCNFFINDNENAVESENFVEAFTNDYKQWKQLLL